MTRSNPAVIPFPKRFEPLDCLHGPVCHFQAAAEVRVAMFRWFPRSGVVTLLRTLRVRSW